MLKTLWQKRKHEIHDCCYVIITFHLSTVDTHSVTLISDVKHGNSFSDYTVDGSLPGMLCLPQV